MEVEERYHELWDLDNAGVGDGYGDYPLDLRVRYRKALVKFGDLLRRIGALRLPDFPKLPAAYEETITDNPFRTLENLNGLVELLGGQPATDFDPERLISGKEYVEVQTAARYLNLTDGHVRKLASQGKLTYIGQGRPRKITTESLRKYKSFPVQKRPA